MRAGRVVASLADQLPPGQVLLDPAARTVYARDASQERGRPLAVALPENVDGVQQVVRWAARRGVPLVARGAGTGLAGGAVARDAVVLSTARLRYLRVEPDALLVEAGAGVRRDDVNRAAAAHGLSYPADPSSGAASTLGGNVACNAGGAHGLSRGVTGRWVQALELVTADGQLRRIGRRAATPPGPDWTALLVGSEGTLGVVTSATLRLTPRPPAALAALAAFPDIASAGAAVQALLGAGLQPGAIELMDQRIMRIVEAWNAPGLPVDAGAALLVEVAGRRPTLAPRLEAITDHLAAHGAQEVRRATDAAQSAALWRARKSAGGAMSRLAPSYYSVDVCVPLSQLAAMLGEIDAILHARHIDAGLVAHVGEGNLHPLLPLDPSDQEQVARTLAASHAIAEAAVRRGGSITGEHGVGREKRELLRLQLDSTTRAAMVELRRTLDAHALFNPGAVLDEASPTEAPSAEPPAAGASPPGWPGTGESVEVREGDLVLVARAEVTVERAVAAALQHGLRLGLDGAWAGLSLGQLLDLGLSGPSRRAYGAPRDLLLAAALRLPDGRMAHSGRAVHKNVAGYDLHRLLVGAAGRLGRYETVVLRLHPRPLLEEALVTFGPPARLAAVGEEVCRRAMDGVSVAMVPRVLLEGDPPALPDGPAVPTSRAAASPSSEATAPTGTTAATEGEMALVVSFHGDPVAVRAELAAMRDVVAAERGLRPVVHHRDLELRSAWSAALDMLHRQAEASELRLLRVGLPFGDVSRALDALGPEEVAALLHRGAAIDIAFGQLIVAASAEPPRSGAGPDRSPRAVVASWATRWSGHVTRLAPAEHGHDDWRAAGCARDDPAPGPGVGPGTGRAYAPDGPDTWSRRVAAAWEAASEDNAS